MSETVSIRIIGANNFQKAVKKNKKKLRDVIKKFITKLLDYSGSPPGTGMAKMLAIRYPFSADEILNFYHVYQSWDTTLIAIGYAVKRGYCQLDTAWLMVKLEHPHASTRYLYNKYAVM